jgi:hypothetical protein
VWIFINPAKFFILKAPTIYYRPEGLLLKNKVISTLILILMIGNLINLEFSFEVSAEETMDDAVEVFDGDILYDDLDEFSNARDYFKIYVESGKYFEVVMKGDQGDFNLYLYNESQELIDDSENSGVHIY